MANFIEFGDCREIMRDWKAEGLQAQMCVTSPPYFGLRDYGHPGQIGLEKTPAEYVAALVEVFDCVRELLADDGVLWLNLGDSYATRWSSARSEGRGGLADNERARHGPPPDGYKNKELMGMPWRVAFALQAAGWYLRQDIIWHKPNPMPESVRDRCTKAHEYIFLLSKSDRYFYDANAIKEPHKWEHVGAMRKGKDSKNGGSVGAPVQGRGNTTGSFRAFGEGGKNKRSVWSVATRPYKGAHFATFPPALIEPCILAGSEPGDIVLDPFMGSGTTAQVALQHGRKFLGCELNEDYAALQQERIRDLA